MVTWAEAAEQMIAVVGQLASLKGELSEWSTGTINGGPNGNGDYPFTQPDGVVVMVPCPQKLLVAHGDPAAILPQLQQLVADAQVAAAAGRLMAVETGYIYRWRDAAKKLLGGFLRDGTFAPLKFRSPERAIDNIALADEAVDARSMSVEVRDRLLGSPHLNDVLQAAPAEAGGGGFRIRLGRRLLVTADVVRGLYPRRFTAPADARVDDDLTTPLSQRIFNGPLADLFSAAAIEAGGGIRIKLGKRLLASFDAISGFYPRRMIAPASTIVDDRTDLTLAQRLLSAAVGQMFRQGSAEASDGFRVKLGDRLLLAYRRGEGLFLPRVLIDDARLSDRPDLPLSQRLGGDFGGAAINDRFIVTSIRKGVARQIQANRISDSATFALTGTGDNSDPVIDDLDRVFYWSADLAALMVQPATGGAAVPAISRSVIACFGDSLTAGTPAQYSESAYPAQLAKLLGREVLNYGVPSAHTSEMLAKQGGTPVRVTLPGNTLVASGTANIASWTASFPIMQTDAMQQMTGTIAGVRVMIEATAYSNNRATAARYTRLEPGAAVPVAANTPFIPDLAVEAAGRTQIVMVGYNDIVFGTGTYAQKQARIVAAHETAIGYLTPIVKRQLVGGILRNTSQISADAANAITATNAQLAAIYGDRFVDTSAAPTPEEMATLGYTPSSADLTQIAADLVPDGMRAPDGVHLGPSGYALWALRFSRVLSLKGW
ncbi:MAG: hypothetical protein U9R64_10305 [Pseudomonadota bacterium]|nr:hypothetical protein [Pseudomonadota bacterium]